MFTAGFGSDVRPAARRRYREGRSQAFRHDGFPPLIGNHTAQVTVDTDTILITHQTAIHNYTIIANYAPGKQMEDKLTREGEADVAGGGGGVTPIGCGR